MKLTALQRRILQRYQTYHSKSPSFPALTVKLIFPLLGAILFLGFTPWIRICNFSLFVSGFLFGAIFAGLLLIRASVKVWPILNIIINWEKTFRIVKGRRCFNQSL